MLLDINFFLFFYRHTIKFELYDGSRHCVLVYPMTNQTKVSPSLE